jgi:16S rRNA (guanine527-N7)-methyltransferase
LLFFEFIISMMKELTKWADGLLDLRIDEEQLAALERYCELLLEWNQKFNLTAITDRKDIIVKHFLDSLTCFRILPRTGSYSLIDLGSGAGIPGIPLKIVNPGIQLTLADSVRKKADFCEIAVQELGLHDVHVVQARAEDLGQNENFREKFDWSVARAVADLSVLAEYLLPLTKIGGHTLAMKGAGVRDEVQRAEAALAILGGRIEQVEQISLPENYGERNLVLIKKVKPTLVKYPRKAGMPVKKPLS